MTTHLLQHPGQMLLAVAVAVLAVVEIVSATHSTHHLYDRQTKVENKWSRLPTAKGELTPGEYVLVDGVHYAMVEFTALKGWHIRMPPRGFVRRLYPNGEKPMEHHHVQSALYCLDPVIGKNSIPECPLSVTLDITLNKCCSNQPMYPGQPAFEPSPPHSPTAPIPPAADPIKTANTNWAGAGVPHPLYDRSRLVTDTWSRLPGAVGEVSEGEIVLVDGVHPVKVELNARKGWHIRMPRNGFVRRLYPNGEKPAGPIEPMEPASPPPYSPPRPTTPTPPQEPTSNDVIGKTATPTPVPTATNATDDGYYTRESQNLTDDWNGVAGQRGRYEYGDWGSATWVPAPNDSYQGGMGW